MTVKFKNHGFAVLETLLLIIIVALVGVVGYKIYNTNKSLDRTTRDTEAVLEQPLPDSKIPGTINTAGDLEAAEKALNDYGASGEDSNDLTQLESQLGAF